MARYISKKNTMKASTAEPLGKPLPGGILLGLHQLSTSMNYKTMLIIRKEKMQKSLLFTIKA